MRGKFSLILGGPASGRELLALARQSAEENCWRMEKQEEDAFRRLLVDAASGRIYLISVSGQPSGFVSVFYRHSLRPAGRLAVIGDFYLTPSVRGGQLSRRVLAAVLHDLEAFGICGVEALAKPDSGLSHLFEAEGFSSSEMILHRCHLEDLETPL